MSQHSRSSDVDALLAELNAKVAEQGLGFPVSHRRNDRKNWKSSRRNNKKDAENTVDVEKMIAELNAEVRAGRSRDKVTVEETSAPCRNSPLLKSQQSQNKSDDNYQVDFESERKNELLIYVNKEIQDIKEENKNISRELEERKREIIEMKKRIEKLEIIIEKKNKTEEKRNEQLEQMADYVEKIRKERDKVEEHAKRYEKELAQNIEEQLDKRMKEIKKKGEEVEEKRKIETESYEKEIQELKWHNEMQERKRKRNNIIIKGVKNIKKNKEDMEKWLRERLETDISMKNIWVIKSTVEKEELIGVELASWEEKKKVMRKKSKLKEKERNVFIDNDLTWQERNVRRIINNEKAEVKKNNQNTTVKVGYYWIEINKIRFVYDERKKEPGLIRIQDQQL